MGILGQAWRGWMTIRVELRGQPVLVVGNAEGLRDAIVASFGRNGAKVRCVHPAETAVTLERMVEAGERLTVIAIESMQDGVLDAAGIDALCRSAARMMVAGARIIIVASALGLVAARDESTESVRSAGIFSLTRSLAMEFGPRGILVNAIAVGALTADGGLLAIPERMLTHTPLARSACADEIASVVLFLADPDNSYTTGHIIAVDGGWTAGYARDF
jgi:NAD(P)-dependent dehydrogenase (short-subunit alcohol dehydrogenase family)